MNKTNYDSRQSANTVNQRKLINGKWKIFCLALGLLCVKCSLYANTDGDNALKERKIVDKNDDLSKDLEEITAEKDPLIRNQKELTRPTSIRNQKNDNLSKNLEEITAEKDPLIRNQKELTRPTSVGNQKELTRPTSVGNQKELTRPTSGQVGKQLALKAAYKNASANSEKRIQELENHLKNTFAENDKLEMENYLLRSDRYKLSKMVSHSIDSLHSLYYKLKETGIDKIQSKLRKIINKLDNGFDAHFQQNFEEDKKIFSSKKKNTDESE
ncbi:MAG: hypothetical protein J5821_03495 [Alphaproteobacteria bacterium]|nr:hypothetical protein [Alphaproteobacteria bacterium]